MCDVTNLISYFIKNLFAFSEQMEWIFKVFNFRQEVFKLFLNCYKVIRFQYLLSNYEYFSKFFLNPTLTFSKQFKKLDS